MDLFSDNESSSLADVFGNSDATFDNWPKRVMHNYVPDAREAIEQAINERWDLFDTTKVTNENYDDFVPSELLYPRFYSE